MTTDSFSLNHGDDMPNGYIPSMKRNAKEDELNETGK